MRRGAWGTRGRLASVLEQEFACAGRDGHTGVLAGVLLWWLLV